MLTDANYAPVSDVKPQPWPDSPYTVIGELLVPIAKMHDHILGSVK